MLWQIKFSLDRLFVSGMYAKTKFGFFSSRQLKCPRVYWQHTEAQWRL